jgi:tRNA nucleotidyltransferase (CCA-adding enzyme)
MPPDDVVPSASVPTLVLPENAPFINRNDTDVVIIRLDSAEESLFETLIKAANAFEQGTITLPNQYPHHINIRVAGGWVRDKLLQKHTHDVDIAIDSISGVDFATIVQLYLKQQALDVHRMGVIAANPSQSKHLETATMIVADMEVDFCNLRSQEIYESHSRIPTTSFGTPLEDAQRRDFTVNALYFNLRTHQVEDWTKRGLRDLKSNILETPLDPNTTFHDDPLRVLRAIRFAVRYDMKFHPQLEEACKCAQVHETLRVKVSRERVGKELEACLSGKSAKPQQALETIASLGLADSVFCLPLAALQGSILGHAWMEQNETQLVTMGWQEAGRIIHLLPPVLQAYLQVKSNISTQLDLRLVHLGTFLSPFRHLHYKEKPGRASKDLLAVAYMVRESIKFKNKDTNGITTIMESVDTMREFLTCAAPAITRLDVGLLLRKAKELWVTCLLVATVLHSHETGKLQIEAFLLLYRTIAVDLQLDECWNMHPLLNGRQVIESLQLPQGPLVHKYLEEQMRWMLANPNGTRDECEQFLLRRYQEETERQVAVDTVPHVSKKMTVESNNGGRTSFP